MKHRLKDLTDHDIHQAMQSPCISKDRLDAIRTERERRELLIVLERILYAHDNHGNGAAMGEAILCQQYASMARYAIDNAS